MPKINKQVFWSQCKAIDSRLQIDPGMFKGILEEIDVFNAGVDTSDLEIQIDAMEQIDSKVKNVRKFVPDKFEKPLTFLTSQLQGNLAKPDLSGQKGKFPKPQLASYKETVPFPDRTPMEIRGEEFFNPTDMHQVMNHLKLICALIHELAKNVRTSPWNNWFPQASYNEVRSAVRNLDLFLSTKCSGITYRKLVTGKRCDNDVVKTSLAGQVVPNVMLPGVSRQDYRLAGGNTNVQSGLRIFFGPLYFSVKEGYDALLDTVPIYRFMTHFHELTHKILKTRDHRYELKNCQAEKNNPDAVECADSWGYYLVDYAGETNQLPES